MAGCYKSDCRDVVILCYSSLVRANMCTCGVLHDFVFVLR